MKKPAWFPLFLVSLLLTRCIFLSVTSAVYFVYLACQWKGEGKRKREVYRELATSPGLNIPRSVSSKHGCIMVFILYDLALRISWVHQFLPGRDVNNALNGSKYQFTSCAESAYRLKDLKKTSCGFILHFISSMEAWNPLNTCS